MGYILGRFLLPHPAIAVPKIGGDQTKAITKTLESFATVGKKVARLKPKTIIVITPHGPCFSDHFYLPDTARISGDLSAFNAKKILLGFDTDRVLAEAIQKSAAQQQLSAGPVDAKTIKRYGLGYDLDHGVIVPLYFINQFYTDYKLLPISLAGLSGKDHYRLGMIINECVNQGNDDAVIIASGDLSHKLKANGPYGFAAEGPAFDKTIQSLLTAQDAYGFLDFDVKRKEKAAQCGFNSYLMLLGTADGYDFHSEIFSYEAPFGVGYLTGEITLGAKKASTLSAYLSNTAQRSAARQELESPPVRLARTALTEFMQNGKETSVPDGFDAGLCERKSGVFVSIKKDGQLRGCIGTTMATHPSVAEEIINNAIAAGTRDPRFAPIQAEELDELSFSVDVLSVPEKIVDSSALDPKKYGVIVENRGKVGILLPDLDGIDTVEDQLKIAREKAGIHPWHTLSIRRFSVIRFE